MKVGTDGVLRSVKSVFDYFVFYEVRLARRPWLVIVVLLFSLGLPIAIAVLGPRDWWLHPSWSLLVYAGVLVKLSWNLVRSDAPQVAKFEFNNKLREDLKSAHAPESERQAGFKRVSRNSGFDGPVVLSDEFNSRSMCDSATDWHVTVHADGDIRKEILDSLKNQRVHFVNYGRQAMLRSILRHKALINEQKVAFAESFPPNGRGISVFQTDYFTSLCSAERGLEDVVFEEDGTKHVLRKAKDWNALHWRDGMFRLPKLFGNSPPMSLHIGVEVLAVSSDNFFRLAVQSSKTEFSRCMRAPLGSGSIDWNDTNGATTLKAIIRNAACRELSEEWGASNPLIFAKMRQLKPEPIGYFRSVLRLGKPQFVCLVRLNCKDHELSADASEVLGDARSRYNAPDLGSLTRVLDSVLDHHGNQIDSAALLGAVHVLRDLIDRRPERIREILSY